MHTGQSPYFQGLRGATSIATPHTTHNYPVTSIPSPQTHSNTNHHPPIVLVLGGPGSGKGTQATQLSEEFHLAHLSTGDLLRNHVSSGTHIGAKIKSHIANGVLVPDECVVAVLLDAVKQVCRRRFRGGVLVDGYPRTLAQAVEFERVVGCGPDMVVFFDAPVGVLEKRLLARGRFDDVPDAITKRLEQHARESPAVIDYFARKQGAAGGGGVFIRESALGSPEDVYKRARRHFLRDNAPFRAPDHQPLVVVSPPAAAIETTPVVQSYPRHYRNQPVAKPYHVPALWRSGRSIPKNLALSFIHTQGASLLARKFWDRVVAPKLS
ncbi:hypothetical protein HDU86_002922 [Geranomyces michiganensis]|nr:hypothetical protein HDU86_002922 [Geranomyces michiganensis]